MEMPSYKAPSPKVTLQRTWFRLKDFVFEALPIMVAGNLVVYLADAMGFLPVVSGWLSPVTVGWLGLPAAAGVVLIFGVLRKELTFVLLAAAMGSTDYASFLTPAQMFVFAFVVMVYVPCVSTIAVLVKEFGLKAATVISAIEVATAVLLGGVILRLMLLMGLG
jgi:ferrous iron transport protein B